MAVYSSAAIFNSGVIYVYCICNCIREGTIYIYIVHVHLRKIINLWKKTKGYPTGWSDMGKGESVPSFDLQVLQGFGSSSWSTLSKFMGSLFGYAASRPTTQMSWAFPIQIATTCQGKHMYVYIYICTANAWALPGPAMTTDDASSSSSSNPFRRSSVIVEV